MLKHWRIIVIVGAIAGVAGYVEYQRRILKEDQVTAAFEISELNAETVESFRKAAWNRQEDFYRLESRLSVTTISSEGKREIRAIVERIGRDYPKFLEAYDPVSGRIANLAEWRKTITAADREKMSSLRKEAEESKRTADVMKQKFENGQL